MIASTDRNVEAVALAIARVIARKTVESEPSIRKMDALGRAAAITTMANNMVGELRDEAVAAIDAYESLQEGAA